MGCRSLGEKGEKGGDDVGVLESAGAIGVVRGETGGVGDQSRQHCLPERVLVTTQWGNEAVSNQGTPRQYSLVTRPALRGRCCTQTVAVTITHAVAMQWMECAPKLNALWRGMIASEELQPATARSHR